MSLYITDESGKLHKIAGAGGGSGVVDSEFSETSENPLQNKVITNKLNSLISKDDIQPHIITGTLLAPYYPQADSTYHTLPLVEYNKTGTKLTLNADGRVVIGKGVSKVKASGTAFMHYGNTSKYHLTACIRKNTTNIVPMLIESSNLYPNVATTLASAPVLIDVTEGDMIDLVGRCNIGSGAFINGLDNQLVTYLTVEVVE